MHSPELSSKELGATFGLPADCPVIQLLAKAGTTPVAVALFRKITTEVTESRLKKQTHSLRSG
ncbi:MAG: hypothetical protein KIT45_01880 [Fimbriimonadia bacterium]|nr:hypothetical protein [Fimbriimonadia bacterium]